MEAWLQGDRAAGAELFALHYRNVARFFHNKVSESAQDDLTNETFLACLRSMPRFRGQANFRTFLFAIARNVLVDHIRRLKLPAARLDSETDVDDTPDDSPDTSPIDNVVQHEEQQVLMTALSRIPRIHRIVLELYYWDDLTAAEVGDLLGIPTATVKTRLRDGREHLKEQLRKVAASPEALRSSSTTTTDLERSPQPADAQAPPGAREDEPDEDEPDEDEPDEEPDED
ncbi:MAG TPA: RNA polymerase sigma factor [Kofleriaceae bacterium]|nr:RNA polymerase sigma factor [Kofleriaceae bacterium]